MWRWGSSTSKDADFAKAHTPGGGLGYDGQILAKETLSSPQSIPAVHQTSDTPQATPFISDSALTPSNVGSSVLDQIVGVPEHTPAHVTIASAEAFSTVPERIGYLKEVCGLDFGWGPSSMMEMALEYIHISGDFSWATSVVILAALIRVLIFIPTLKSSDTGAKWKMAQPLVAPAREKLSLAYKAKDFRRMAEAKAELKALRKAYGVNPVGMFIPIIIQIPLQFGGFRVLRNMSELPVPALKTEDWLWTTDLTLGDPYFLLPLINGLVLYLTIKVRHYHPASHFPFIEINPSYQCSEVVKRATPRFPLA